MALPTPDQQRVLEYPAPRVRVVRSTPGSGKTWLVAEVIRQELNGWDSAMGGIAALSFTRVGGAEIRNAIGHDLTHPHFVGTIDAFVFRYIVRPFLSRCFPAFPPARLVAGEWSPKQWGKYAAGKSATTNTGVNVFGCVFVGEAGKHAVISYAKPFQPLKPLAGTELAAARELKKEVWLKSGLLTHSDVAFWASKILDHQEYGARVIAEIVRRFPLIIVDEVQDTGYFLGKALRKLLASASTRGVAVGDPDQAIYEFNGARPDLFHGFEALNGAHTLSLSNSLRCPAPIAAVASLLKDSGGIVGPAEANTGRAFLVCGDNMTVEVCKLLDSALSRLKADRIRVIARQNATVDLLTARKTKNLPKLNSPALSHLSRAVLEFTRANQSTALAQARAALECALFGHEHPPEGTLNSLSIESQDWKRLAVDCLFMACNEARIGTLYDWQTQLGKQLDARIAEFCEVRSIPFTKGRLKPKKVNGWNVECAAHFPDNNASATSLDKVLVTTVHAVKGETHDLTIFVCPGSDDPDKCCSMTWWSHDESHREEKRIAYVAITRTQGDLVLWVGHSTHERLVNERPTFVACFEQMSIDDVAHALTSPPTPVS